MKSCQQQENPSIVAIDTQKYLTIGLHLYKSNYMISYDYD